MNIRRGGALPSTPMHFGIKTDNINSQHDKLQRDKLQRDKLLKMNTDSDSDSDDIYEELVGLDSTTLWKWFEQKSKQK